jgi:hypothetical protein
MLDKCNELAKSPAAPENEAMKEAEISLTEENLKKDASEIKTDDRPVIPAKDETTETPDAVPMKEVKVEEKKVKKETKKEVKKESKSPEKTEENTQVTSGSAW